MNFLPFRELRDPRKSAPSEDFPCNDTYWLGFPFSKPLSPKKSKFSLQNLTKSLKKINFTFQAPINPTFILFNPPITSKIPNNLYANELLNIQQQCNFHQLPGSIYFLFLFLTFKNCLQNGNFPPPPRSDKSFITNDLLKLLSMLPST